MARNHGRILTGIWSDPDFRDRTPEAQRLYLFLVSQPNLNHAGLLPLTLRRWASTAAGLTVADVQKSLEELAAARFVVIDEDSEELLVRTLVRNDGIWKQPKVMLAMESAAREITSPALQIALLAELDRLNVSALSDEPPKSGESARATVAGVIGRLREAFAKTSGRVSGRVSGTPSELFAVANAGSTADPHTCAHAHSPAPAPAPAPVPPSAGAAAPRGTDLAGSTDEPTVTQRSKRITDAYANVEPLCKWPAVNAIVLKAIKAGKWTDEQIQDALLRLADDNRGVTVETLRRELAPPAQQPGRGSQSRNAGILSAAMQRAIAAEQAEAAQQNQFPRGAISV